MPVFAALGDPTRFALLRTLCTRGPASITRLSENAGVTRQAITKHLRVLADVGLVQGERKGRAHVWAFRPRRLNEAKRALDEISRGWDAALARLARFIED